MIIRVDIPTMTYTLGDWADAASIAGAIVAVVGLAFVIVQLRGAAAAARAQATIQFQQAFRESKDSRTRLLQSFPVHQESLGDAATALGDDDAFATWSELGELTEAEKQDADAVINALNDVAQYVTDGLSLRSAMQQYHTVFIRAGFLVAPYIDAKNKGGRARWGVRVIELFNAALGYHRSHPKHRGKALVLSRQDPDGALVLIDNRGEGIQMHRGYPSSRSPFQRVGDRLRIRSAVRDAERTLRR